MISIDIADKKILQNYVDAILNEEEPVSPNSLEERVRFLLVRDLLRLDWRIEANNGKVILRAPENYNKQNIKESMAIKRGESIVKKKEWIQNHIKLARENLADGYDALNSEIKPIIEVCKTEEQNDIFRIFRYYWSSPYSDYVGRRIRLIIRDGYLPNKPVIGIAALGSPIIHIPARDEWIGWNKEIRTKKLIYTMDAYVLGALPPYNYLLGGKLVSYILASNEIRNIHRKKYKNDTTIIAKRKANDLVCIFTTSLYGKSSQYNRIKYNDRLLYIPIGETKGYGTFHLTNEVFYAMLELLKSKNIYIGNKFGDGPMWRMRVINRVGDIIGFDSDSLLKHSFKRSVYAIPLAQNFKEYLNDKDNSPDYFDYPLNDLVNFWKERWLENRKQSLDTIEKVSNFKRQDFSILDS